MPFHVLIAEDEESLANALELNLRLEGYQVTLCRSGSHALEVVNDRNHHFDLALLDVMLPGVSGLDVCAAIRKTDPSLPVMFLTARAQVGERREGLRLGADDYVTKPFDLEELLLRIANLLKRSARPPKQFTFTGGAIDFNTFEITDRNGKTHTLSRRELGLLSLLTANPGKVVSRDDILNTLWEPDENASSRTIDNYILGFRKFFEKNPRSPQHFFSVRGVGYKFVP